MISANSGNLINHWSMNWMTLIFYQWIQKTPQRDTEEMYGEFLAEFQTKQKTKAFDLFIRANWCLLLLLIFYLIIEGKSRIYVIIWIWSCYFRHRLSTSMKNSDMENTKPRSNLPHLGGLFDPFEEAQCRKSSLPTANKRFLPDENNTGN